MQLLNSKFLQQISRKYDLTDEQQEVFIALFSSNKNQIEVAQELHISNSALRTRMTGVYQKFGFTDNKLNKSRRLHDLLLKQEREYISKSEQLAALENADIEELVIQVRKAIADDVRERCGKMQVLDMTQPIELNDIYTNVNILEKITAYRRLSLEDLQEIDKFDLKRLDRIGLGKISEEKIAGIKAVKKYSNIVIWGKPGAGKTTFLKYLAIKCISRQFKQDFIPIFVTLRRFAEDENKYGLGMYVAKYIAQFGVSEIYTDKLLRAGKLLILAA